MTNFDEIDDKIHLKTESCTVYAENNGFYFILQQKINRDIPTNSLLVVEFFWIPTLEQANVFFTIFKFKISQAVNLPLAIFKLPLLEMVIAVSSNYIIIYIITDIINLENDFHNK